MGKGRDHPAALRSPARPETVKSQRKMNLLETYVLKEKGKNPGERKERRRKIGAGRSM